MLLFILLLGQLVQLINQFKEKGLIRNWSNERIVRYILTLTLSYVLPMMLNDNEDLDIDEAVMK